MKDANNHAINSVRLKYSVAMSSSFDQGMQYVQPALELSKQDIEDIDNQSLLYCALVFISSYKIDLMSNDKYSDIGMQVVEIFGLILDKFTTRKYISPVTGLVVPANCVGVCRELRDDFLDYLLAESANQSNLHDLCNDCVSLWLNDEKSHAFAMHNVDFCVRASGFLDWQHNGVFHSESGKSIYSQPILGPILSNGIHAYEFVIDILSSKAPREYVEVVERWRLSVV